MSPSACPFCAEPHPEVVASLMHGSWTSFIERQNCGARGPSKCMRDQGECRDAVTEHWNERPMP